MAKIEFNKQEKALIIRKIQLYFAEELEQKIGQFDAEFLLDFFSREVGAYHYNRGLLDAQAVLSSRVEDIQGAIYDLQQYPDVKK